MHKWDGGMSKELSCMSSAFFSPEVFFGVLILPSVFRDDFPNQCFFAPATRKNAEL